MPQPINEQIETRRLELGLDDVEVAARCGLSIYEYGDVESYPDEFATVLDVEKAKRLCRILGLDIFSLTGLEPPDPSQGNSQRNDVVTHHLGIAKLARSDVAKRANLHDEALAEIEADSSKLDLMPVQQIIELAKALGIKPGLLIGT